MAIVYIAFGSNLGDRNKNIQDAISLLKSHQDIQIKKISSIIETEPENPSAQDKFLNGAIQINTDLTPRDLLLVMHWIENSLGRERVIKNGPRTIDLDLLFYEDKIIETPDLTIPHPRLHKRDFVLRPLCEIAPDFIHPVLKEKIVVIARRLPKAADKAIS